MRRVTRSFVAALAAVAPAVMWAGPEEPDALEEPPEAPLGDESAVNFEFFPAGSNRIDWEGEALFGSDITVLRTAASFEQEREDFTIGATLAYTDIDIDYRPQTVTFPSNRSESNREAQLDGSWAMTSNLSLTALARIYEGFPDYRSVWIAEYYEQFFGPVPGFREPDPGGWALGSGAVWDPVPGVTRLTFSIGYGEDDVVEGWSFGGAGLERSASTLESITAGVVWEQAINGWLKAETSLRFLEVSRREPRFQVQTSWAAALGPKWTIRANAGATRERPNFEAYFAGLLVDYEFLPAWHLSLNGRYYEDTGEIETAGFSTSAPGLQSAEVGASLLYDDGDFAVRLSGGFFNSDYDPLDPTNVFFGGLYRDRDWWLTRLAVSYSF